ncbi:MAG: hypothetical protein ACM3SM_06130 [Bacteroidota bacterium]
MVREIKELKAIRRRRFFSSVGKIFGGVMIAGFLPERLFGKFVPAHEPKHTAPTRSGIAVKIHPQAVKRNKKG